jgi:hypothetical protein
MKIKKPEKIRIFLGGLPFGQTLDILALQDS